MENCNCANENDRNANDFCYFVVDLISAELYSKYQVIDTKLNMILLSLNSNKKMQISKRKKKYQYNIQCSVQCTQMIYFFLEKTSP